MILKAGGSPSFKGYRGFPNSTCISINEEVVHGIPNKRKFRPGDIISIDCGVQMDGYHGDMAYTIALEPVSEEVRSLIKVTKESLYLGIQQARVGNRVGNIGHAVNSHVQANGFSVVRNLSGHGIGRDLHEAPQVPNHSTPNQGILLQPGMTLAIEPMVNMGSWGIRESNDGWTIIAADRKPSCHFEHTILVTDGDPEILTTFDFIDK
jgi:methionyl aminopeptidase